MSDDSLVGRDDALSAALLRMQLKAFKSVALDLGGANWAVEFAGIEGLSFNVVQRGEGWLWVAGRRQKVLAGDCFLLVGGRPFSVTRTLTPKKRTPGMPLLMRARNGVSTLDGGGDFLVAGTLFRVEGILPQVIFGRLPPVIRVPGDSDAAAVLRWSLERFGAELRGSGAGRSLLLHHLAPIMLVQTLRLYLERAGGDQNWLTALSDPRLARVVDALQRDFARSWSLEALAAQAGMSRSAFAATFKKKIGVAPMDYLASWRMQVACERLQSGEESLAAIASAVGYASESAFSVAFTRIVGRRPGAYRRDRLAA